MKMKKAVLRSPGVLRNLGEVVDQVDCISSLLRKIWETAEVETPNFLAISAKGSQRSP